MSTRMQPRTVLVLCDNPMTAALLGMLLELEGYEPAFTREGENAETALARVKPLLVVLVDVALDVSRSDLFLARAARRQIGIVMFGGPASVAGPSPWAQSRRVPWFHMPVDGAELRRAIEASTASFRLWRTDIDRRRARTETDTDGTLVYHDRDGGRWRIYDRRGADRRQSSVRPIDPAVAGGHRAFVNDAGEEWRLEMSADDFRDESAATLEQQLARATKSDVG
jgi:CheY-like chemotaxis protein